MVMSMSMLMPSEAGAELAGCVTVQRLWWHASLPLQSASLVHIAAHTKILKKR